MSLFSKNVVEATDSLTPPDEQCRAGIIVEQPAHSVALKCTRRKAHAGPHGCNLDGRHWAAHLEWMDRGE